MRLSGGALLLLAFGAAVPGPAAAQQRSEPQLLLSLFGGVTTGSQLWEINRQRLTRLSDVGSVDSLRLTRRLEPGITFGASATYFPSPHLGLHAEILLYGLGVDDGCTLAYVDPSPVDSAANRQVCADIARRASTASTIGFLVGGFFRAAPRAFASPYARVHVGFTTRTLSTVEVTGRYVDASGASVPRLILDDPGGSGILPTAGVGVGVMIPIAAGYQVALEFRDNVLGMRRPSGPATSLATPPVETTFVQAFSILLRLDIVLEQRRGRRY